MTGSAEISECGKYRYRLTRQWNSQPWVMWIMLNPSNADAMKDDPTIRRVIGFSMNHGFGGCVIHNLFALRSTERYFLLNKSQDPVGPHNDSSICSDAIEEDGTPKMPIICAWGNVFKTLRWRVEIVLEMLQGLDLHYLKLGTAGDPCHPLYLPSALRMQKWSAHDPQRCISLSVRRAASLHLCAK